MPNLRQRLPPLDALVMFEAAARQASFTTAAAELHVTQAAVSRQIRLLEENLGIRLFTRSRRGVELTHHGRELQRTVSFTLRELASTTLRLRQGSVERVTIAMDQSIAGLWLTPRLPEFQRAHQDINFRLVVSDDEADCVKQDVDVAILHGDGNWPGYEARLLFGDEVFPVCSPTYLETHESIGSATDLAAHTLIDHEDDHGTWINWAKWQHLNNVAVQAEQRNLFINNYPVLIQAACDGQGIALGWSHLVGNLIESGRLVRLLPGVTTTDFGYYVLSREQRASKNVDAFIAWVFGCSDREQNSQEGEAGRK